MAYKVNFPPGLKLVKLDKTHNRKKFCCNEPVVDEWLKSKARQSQDENLSRTKVLVNSENEIAGFYTLAIYRVNFDELPYEVSRNLPHTLIPAMKLAWLGVDQAYTGRGLAKRLLASALLDCYFIGMNAPFCVVLIDCVNEDIKGFYRRFDFIGVPVIT